MDQLRQILSYELHNLLRSRWLLFIAIFFFLTTETLFRFGSDPTKVLVALMNIVLIVNPLVAMILGLVFFYHSRDFIELLLAQPVRRSAVFLGKVLGISLALSGAFLVGVIVPFLLNAGSISGYAGDFAVLIVVGGMLMLAFVALSFLIATTWDDRIKGFGAAIMTWLYLAVIYDALILVGIYIFREYPLERPLMVLAMLNPIDLGRITILLRLDVSALMGMTGALFTDVLGGTWGMVLAATVLILWQVVPLALGLRRFQKRDF